MKHVILVLMLTFGQAGKTRMVDIKFAKKFKDLPDKVVIKGISCLILLLMILTYM